MITSESYLSYFTPGQIPHDTLEFILVKRQKLIERLVERVSHSVLTAAKHQSILLGPRGMGKSHVVALVYHRVKKLPELEDKVVLAWLAEEEWGVASLTDLFLVILKALAREYPQSGLQKEIDALYRLPYSQVGDAAAQTLRNFAADRTLFLIVENLEEIFRGLGEQGQWAFRSFLSEHPFVTILATTPSLFTGIQKQQQAFYGFFQQTYLDELTSEEATELLGKVAERRGDTRLTDFLKTSVAGDRVQAVHDLAGGHPRIYLLFAHLITEESLDELVTPFLQLLDELTPYYQSRMQLLSPQQRKIAEYLCDRRGAVNVKDIAARNLLTSQIAAKQLGDLERMGYVRKTAAGRESFYELREPLLRMVIEMKRGRGEPIRLVIDFLRRWYSRAERRERLMNSPTSASLTRQYFEASLDLELAQLDTPNPARAESLSPEYRKALADEDFGRAAEIIAEIIERKGSNCDTGDWFQYGCCHIATGDFDQALMGYNKATEIEPVSANSWYGLAVCLHALSRNAEALTSYNKAIKIDLTNASMWFSRGVVLSNLNQYNEALSNYDKAIDINPTHTGALFSRGKIFLLRHQWENFLAAIRQGFDAAKKEDEYRGDVQAYCYILLESDWSDENKKLAELSALYTDFDTVFQLASGLTKSIPALFEPEITNTRAEKWLAAWQAAGEGKPDFEVPLRLLAAAVAWKPKRDVRALLALPIEERRILEQLLPMDAEAKS